MHPLQTYRQLLRRVRKLPFNAATIGVAASKLRAEFSGQRRRNARSYIAAIDALLVHEQYDKLHAIADLVYKKCEPQPLWVYDYHKMTLAQVVSRWPKRHLIEEITKDEKELAQYYAQVKQQSSTSLPWKHLPLTPGVTPMHASSERTDNDAVARLIERYTFVHHHQHSLTHLKLRPVEILYPLNALGRPLQPNRIAKIDRQTVAYVTRTACESLAPIRQLYLTDLHRFVTSIDENVNARFFRAIAKKRALEAPISPRQARCRQRVSMPSHNSIKKILREYVMRQYYWDETAQQYRLSPMKDFYEPSM